MTIAALVILSALIILSAFIGVITGAIIAVIFNKYFKK